MRISDWSSDVCSSDLRVVVVAGRVLAVEHARVAAAGEGVENQVDELTPGHRRQRRQPGRGLVAAHDHQPEVQGPGDADQHGDGERSEEHTSELQSLMRISYAVFCLKKITNVSTITVITQRTKVEQQYNT